MNNKRLEIRLSEECFNKLVEISNYKNSNNSETVRKLIEKEYKKFKKGKNK